MKFLRFNFEVEIMNLSNDKLALIDTLMYCENMVIAIQL